MKKNDIINNEGSNVGQNCGTVESYDNAKEYFDFHENKHRIVKISIYQRKYHLENVINDLRSLKQFVHSSQLQIDQVILCLKSSVNQKRLLADNKLKNMSNTRLECADKTLFAVNFWLIARYFISHAISLNVRKEEKSKAVETLMNGKCYGYCLNYCK